MNLAKGIVSCIEPLSMPFKTLDPFLFCVYHKDYYPAGDGKMQAPRRGNGADFDPNAGTLSWLLFLLNTLHFPYI